MERENKQSSKGQVVTQKLSETFQDNLTIQQGPMETESAENIVESDFAKVDTDQEVSSIKIAKVHSVKADKKFAFKDELLAENGSNEDKSRPMFFGPIKKQKKLNRNRGQRKPKSSSHLFDTIRERVEGESESSRTPKTQSKRQRSGDNTPNNNEKRSKAIDKPKQEDQQSQAALVNLKNQQERPYVSKQVNRPKFTNASGRPNQSDSKQQGGDQRETYAEISSKDLNVLVIDEQKGISKDQVGILEEKLMEMLDAFLETNPSVTPNFWASSYAFNNVKFVCDNDFSVKWLRDAVSSMPSPWKGAKLTAITLSEKLKRESEQKPQIKFFVPDGTKKKSFEAICKHIELRNQPIKTENWNMWKEESVPNGSFYHITADEGSVKEIQQKGGRLFYYFSTIKIIIPKGKIPEEK